jgi:Zn-dependent metalloprotease
MRTTAALGAAALAIASLAAGATAAGAAPSTTAGTRADQDHLVMRQADEDGPLARSAIEAVENHPGAAKVGPGQGFSVTDALVDPDGTSHVRLTRTYHHLPVLGGDLVVHRGPNGGWEGTSQTLDSVLRLGVTPAVSRAEAKDAATAPSPANRPVHDQSAEAPRLVVDATNARPRLAWEVTVVGTRADGTPSALATYVDARTGEVLWTAEQVETVDGQGQTLYSGTVPLQISGSSGSYSLQDPTRGGTYTTDMNNTSDSMFCQLFGSRCSKGTLFTSTDTVFGDGTTSNRESAAADAQYGTNETWDYYQNVHGRTGIAGDGAGSYNRVHYGQDYVNAFWQDGCFCMTYGDGDGVDYGPLTSLDVAGHEMSHGVTASTANLTYSGESGGLNESTSDIFGSMVEFYAANSNDPGDYLIGEEFDYANHAGFRRMDDPASDGSSANCWSSTVGSLDVHYSSGVGNHFFYLLSEGSGAKTLNGVSYDSPTCDGSTVTGIGHDAAADIWYRALSVYMTSSTDYHGARTATLAAAADLYGAGSTQYAAVNAAWAAVGVV